MNKSEHIINRKGKIDGRIKDFLIVIGLALILGVSVWNVFYNDEPIQATGAMNETEQKISRLLTQIDGVGVAEVMIYQSEEGETSAVVVCDGAKDFQVLICIREAVATALGTEEKAVKVYLKKD